MAEDSSSKWSGTKVIRFKMNVRVVRRLIDGVEMALT